jgi:hypothetical protein
MLIHLRRVPSDSKDANGLTYDFFRFVSRPLVRPDAHYSRRLRERGDFRYSMVA